ncbi:MAG: hypothetical protein Kow0069_31400 [Promethearchaeota archaeon]
MLVGLDNAGKSSIALAMTRQTNLLSYYSVRPTVGIRRVEASCEEPGVGGGGGGGFVVWDLGGQAAYRADFGNRFEEVARGAFRIVFVVDVLDVERYDEALDFLKKVLDLTRRHFPDVRFSVFFHKWDPWVEVDDDPGGINASVDRLVTEVRKVISDCSIEVRLFKTSIFTTFRVIDVPARDVLGGQRPGD